MQKKILFFISCLILPSLSVADKLTLTQDAPKTYVVKKGDTLWDISAIFLNEPWLWPKLWRINPEIANPHLIYPGDQLRLVFDANGQPMLVKGKPTLKWSPQVRTKLKEQNPIETVSLETISPYIRYGTILSPQEIDSSPYVLGSDNGHKSSIEGYKLYVTGDLDVGQSYAVYHKGDAIEDPVTKEVVAYEAILVGTGKGIRRGNMADKEPSTVYIEGAEREIRSGDIVKPVNEGQLFPSFFTMQPTSVEESGRILSSVSKTREFGKFEVVILDLGIENGVKLGDLFSISRKSPGVVETENGPVYTEDASLWTRLASESDSDYKMPYEEVGKMMVFKTFDQLSMAVVMHASKPLRLEDTVAQPIAP